MNITDSDYLQFAVERLIAADANVDGVFFDNCTGRFPAATAALSATLAETTLEDYQSSVVNFVWFFKKALMPKVVLLNRHLPSFDASSTSSTFIQDSQARTLMIN